MVTHNLSRLKRQKSSIKQKVIAPKKWLSSEFAAWKEDILTNKYKILLALFFFVLSLIAVYISSNYVDETNAIAVPDLLLDAIPTINLTFLYIWGAVIVFAVYLLYPILFEPKKFHFALGMLSLFLLVRSAFIILTHLKSPVGAITVIAPGFLQLLATTNDLFFSGHTGLPFLGFLVFSNKVMKGFMLTASIIMVATVLLMHVHYSIDVASAYFITYGIYTMGVPLFGDSTQSNRK